MDEDLNIYIKKSHIRAVERFAQELEDFRKETGDDVAVLYENAYTPFTLSNIVLSEGCLNYEYDGESESEKMVFQDENGVFYETDGLDSIMEYVRYWKACLARAKRYWSMDLERFDAIQSGEEDDEED